MKLIEGGPPALPGSCYLCASGSRAKYVDLETQVEFHGAMYLCDLCVLELGRLIGMASEKEVTDIQLDNIALQDKKGALERELEATKKVLDGYDDVRAFLDSDSFAGQSGDMESVSISERAKDVGDGESGPSESSNDEGVDELRSTDDSSEYSFGF